MKIELVVELCNRINKLLEEIKNNYKDKSILLVTHRGTAFTGVILGIINLIRNLYSSTKKNLVN